MLKWSSKKNFLFRGICFIYIFSFINLYLFNQEHGFFYFFLKGNYQKNRMFYFINYYYGYSFVPCFIISFISYFFSSNSYFYLFFLHSMFMDFLFSIFQYGGGISHYVYVNFGKYICFLCSLFLGIFAWIIFLYLILENKKEERRLVKKNSKSLDSKIYKIQENKIHLPTSDLLSIGKKIHINIDLESQKLLLIKTLHEFGIEAKINDVFIGPVVTLYSIELAPGTKAIRVINLADDISRSMEAYSVRISSIPGKNLLGVEISNNQRQIVFFKEGILSDEFNESNANLPLYLGCNIYGQHEVFDLSSMPHLLVAGTTGSGKSVCVHTMLLSLMFQKTYEEVKLILIDPKKLELTPYENIPHLLLPIVTESKQAIRAVKWAVNEMETRYKTMSKLGVRNINSYNFKISEATFQSDENYQKFPYIVIVIDEMADLMLLAGKEFELYVQRLAQMGRAAGVHMIIATQRPSVDVITGTIKANFPTRISFKLSTKVDSRTILGDMSGAEQLLGAGDMLYLGNNGRLTRIHASYVSEEDVLLVVDFLKSQGSPSYLDLHVLTDDSDDESYDFTDDENDPLFDEAVKLIRHEKKVSTSFLQRCFPIGYNRAAKLIEKMEKEGIITKGDRFGRNREILE